MLNWFKSTFTYWVELYKDIRIWWIFRRTAREYTDQLNKDFQLRVDWLGRVYGVVNLPEEVQTASGEIQQAYVLNKISTYGNFMMQIVHGTMMESHMLCVGEYGFYELSF